MVDERNKQIVVYRYLIYSRFTLCFLGDMESAVHQIITLTVIVRTFFCNLLIFNLNYKNLEMIESFRFKMKISQQKTLEKQISLILII